MTWEQCADDLITMLIMREATVVTCKLTDDGYDVDDDDGGGGGGGLMTFKKMR